jgi:hypothetical protein
LAQQKGARLYKTKETSTFNPPQNALIFAIDEKPAIQALERAQGWIRLPNGKALTGFSHEYKGLFGH